MVTGVAAQHLQFHPNATAKDLRKSLIRNATQGVVLGAGPVSPNVLLYTNNTQAPPEEGNSGLSTGAIVGIAIGSAAGERLLACLFAVVCMCLCVCASACKCVFAVLCVGVCECACVCGRALRVEES